MGYFTNGLIKENPTLRLVLGTCPTLAVTTAAINAALWVFRQRCACMLEPGNFAAAQYYSR
ncbi:MAG: Rnf-Nqr domain containing protein [Oscillospiraceae bacterium]